MTLRGAALVYVAVTIALVAAGAVQAQERQQLLSTAEWVELSNSNQKVAFSYVKGALDTLGAIGNFTCTKPAVMRESAARILVDAQKNPEKIHRWFLFALMSDMTRHYHCRFVDPGRLTYTNQKLAEWERGE